jgi:hypothetical protein
MPLAMVAGYHFRSHTNTPRCSHSTSGESYQHLLVIHRDPLSIPGLTYFRGMLTHTAFGLYLRYPSRPLPRSLSLVRTPLSSTSSASSALSFIFSLCLLFQTSHRHLIHVTKALFSSSSRPLFLSLLDIPLPSIHLSHSSSFPLPAPSQKRPDFRATLRLEPNLVHCT